MTVVYDRYMYDVKQIKALNVVNGVQMFEIEGVGGLSNL